MSDDAICTHYAAQIPSRLLTITLFFSLLFSLSLSFSLSLFASPSAFGVKKKCDDGIRQSRNNIPVANPGDKLYSAVEYSPSFYKEFNSDYSRVGGSTGTGGKKLTISAPGQAKIEARARDSTKLFNPAGMMNTMSRHDTLNFRPRLSYEEKVRIAATQAAIAEVGELTEGVVDDRNEEGLSWEQRTGLYVWKTKEQKMKDTNAATKEE